MLLAISSKMVITYLWALLPTLLSFCVVDDQFTEPGRNVATNLHRRTAGPHPRQSASMHSRCETGS
ncbi:hypothetical protein MLPF_2918 [Mycobacterium lepromatosis]|nr:hypothetical protein MLPF_2918 [Mycobacterium lepromatosis]